jgi:hypothetical protein
MSLHAMELDTKESRSAGREPPMSDALWRVLFSAPGAVRPQPMTLDDFALKESLEHRGYIVILLMDDNSWRWKTTAWGRLRRSAHARSLGITKYSDFQPK